MLETLLTKIQKFTVLALAGMLAVVVLLSTLHLGVLPHPRHGRRWRNSWCFEFRHRAQQITRKSFAK